MVVDEKFWSWLIELELFPNLFLCCVCVFYCFPIRVSLCNMSVFLSWNLLCSSGWHQIQRCCLSSQVLGLMTCSTMLNCFSYFNCFLNLLSSACKCISPLKQSLLWVWYNQPCLDASLKAGIICKPQNGSILYAFQGSLWHSAGSFVYVQRRRTAVNWQGK